MSSYTPSQYTFKRIEERARENAAINRSKNQVDLLKRKELADQLMNILRLKSEMRSGVLRNRYEELRNLSSAHGKLFVECNRLYRKWKDMEEEYYEKHQAEKEEAVKSVPKIVSKEIGEVRGQYFDMEREREKVHNLLNEKYKLWFDELRYYMDLKTRYHNLQMQLLNQAYSNDGYVHSSQLFRFDLNKTSRSPLPSIPAYTSE